MWSTQRSFHFQHKTTTFERRVTKLSGNIKLHRQQEFTPFGWCRRFSTKPGKMIQCSLTWGSMAGAKGKYILVFWWIEGHFAEENNYWYQPWHCLCGRPDYPGKDATLRRFEKFTLDHGGYQAVIISPHNFAASYIKRVMVWILLIYANVWRISCQSGEPSWEESIDEQCQLKMIAKSAFPTIPDFSFRPIFVGSLCRDVDVLRGVQPDVCAV